MTPATPEDTTPEDSAQAQPAPAEPADAETPDVGEPAAEDDIRRKYLQALAHKHAKAGTSSAARETAARQGGGSQNTRQSRMFRRKSGG